MPILPNAEQAVIAIEKLQNYALNEAHPVGKHKAYLFKTILQISSEDAEELKSIILENIVNADSTEQNSDEYGSRYKVTFECKRKGGIATIVTSWIIRKEENFPRLTSCYIKKNKNE